MAEDDWSEEEGFGGDDTEDISCDFGCTEFCTEPQTKELGLCTTDCQIYLCCVEADADGGTGLWVCSECGCTDTKPCPGGCHWVRKNLCSKCAEKPKQQHMDQSIAKFVESRLKGEP
jgi:hypothetical protein